jgi:EAL domain-containing protein (putative c-di-GMP-specific phosphodiesterase class I)
MRWTDPKLGFIPPDEFIAIAEQSGLISAVTYWVIDRVIADAALMHEQNLNVCIAVNLSARDLEDPLLLNKIKVGLEKVKLPASALSFEITEGDLVEDAKTAVEHLQAYRKQGHKLAIDDFGTGYSSLGYLKSFPVDTLKIDKSFVLELSNNKDDQDIVQTVMQLANKFNLSVVAEGVEDKEALQYLADNGCTWAQGYYICRPIPLNDLIKWCSEEEQTVWLSE